VNNRRPPAAAATRSAFDRLSTPVHQSPDTGPADTVDDEQRDGTAERQHRKKKGHHLARA
jgi:hypothetical protein